VNKRVDPKAGLLEVRLHSITATAEDVHLFELRPVHGSLPAFDPGAHIDVHLPNGMLRSYSLLNDSSERHRYVLGISRDRSSRGGSSWLHEVARVGDRVAIGVPRNHFPLDESAPHSVLIAGGIGVTPLWCMAQRLEQIERPWSLHYSSRSRAGAALADEIETFAAASKVGRLQMRMDKASGVDRLDLRAVVGEAPPGSHFYCCGPAAMLEAFRAACDGLAEERVHFEYFAPPDEIALAHGGFSVVLARSHKRVNVAADQSILDALRAEGVDVPSSCEQGICGACETAVLEGVPDHRDLVLSAKERASNKVMMICCSGAKSQTLVLDA
jgi:ferredoxin-NADP reductase